MNSIRDLYYEWLIKMVMPNKSLRDSYDRLLLLLFNTTFRYSIRMDENRYDDGIDLRYRFTICTGSNYDAVKDAMSSYPCSVLEMMAALAMKCEEEIMFDSSKGDRTSNWFFIMLQNLGLDNYFSNFHYSTFELEVNQKLNVFMDRKYSSNGKGGLFIINNMNYDMRNVEIWYQMSWYMARLSLESTQ